MDGRMMEEPVKFRKKPVVVEAIQFLGRKNWFECWIFVDTADPILEVTYDDEKETLTIPTLEGDHLATKGDWIIKGVAGECYPCKPDIFDLTYEKVEEKDE